MTRPALDVEYHTIRVLILLEAMTRRRASLEGLTKLAKLDFLLRYPSFLERLLERDGLEWPPGAGPTDIERDAVESRMVRYRYGPWDDLYYPIVGGLVSRDLVEVDRRGNRVSMRLTERGRQAARLAREGAPWAAIGARCDLLAQHFDLTGNQLKSRIYDELPEVVDRPYRSQI